jgi:catechol 2,3-dioxygenase-like lactoylglutathione lyase family enzyme
MKGSRRSREAMRRLAVVAALVSITLLSLLAAKGAAQAPPAADVQSILLRAVTVTYDLERSLLFYRDILGQEVVEDVPLSTERSRTWVDVSADAELRFVVLRGRAEYPGGPIAGGRIAFIGVREPDGRRPPARANRRGTQGDLILPHRVRGLDAIYERLQREGFEILFAPRASSTGLSRTMMVFDPNGHIVELFELR